MVGPQFDFLVGDGINDEDNCPNAPGTASNHGCPEIDAGTQSKVDMMAKGTSWAHSDIVAND